MIRKERRSGLGAPLFEFTVSVSRSTGSMILPLQNWLPPIHQWCFGASLVGQEELRRIFWNRYQPTADATDQVNFRTLHGYRNGILDCTGV
jgi:hypothetical protein